jgi:hypothetical protein
MHFVAARREHDAGAAGTANRRALGRAAFAAEQGTQRRAGTGANGDLLRVLALRRRRLVRDRGGCDVVALAVGAHVVEPVSDIRASLDAA